MIASIRGTVQAVGERFVILENGGVGYRVHVTPHVASRAHIGEERVFFTYHQVAETTQELFGFPSLKEVSFFELLLTIASVGPKTALSVMSVATLDELTNAIQAGDPTILTKVSGVGKKTAERIVLELREKIDASVPATTTEAMKDDAAVLEALISLGYTRSDARTAVRALPPSVIGVSDRVRAALKNITSHESGSGN
jgi:Holliday junction DNA helicase RuvA